MLIVDKLLIIIVYINYNLYTMQIEILFLYALVMMH